MKLDFSKGLIPAIVVDDATGDVLMLAYMNEEAYEKTLETKETWFYSRSRGSLWHK
ncbi:MAG: bifunctional phosphoribosyl-AMP cyclohydrolase/phosphoribosyl-ATP diphosphatase, partial [Bacillus sp. (in: Bacteria)]|nr:bifunctional phosphoribosyl-AMP cyclohydrolase/phosphoribosyl-ATP diphosphatase [Bacillus sp. (in: firmicutes)]